MSNQRKRMILYLNKIQDDFIKYLNRNPEKNDIIPVYIDKYNKIMNLNSRLTKNQRSRRKEKRYQPKKRKIFTCCHKRVRFIFLNCPNARNFKNVFNITSTIFGSIQLCY